MRRGGLRLTPNSRRNSLRAGVTPSSPRAIAPPVSKNDSFWGGQLTFGGPQIDCFSQQGGHCMGLMHDPLDIGDQQIVDTVSMHATGDGMISEIPGSVSVAFSNPYIGRLFPTQLNSGSVFISSHENSNGEVA